MLREQVKENVDALATVIKVKIKPFVSDSRLTYLLLASIKLWQGTVLYFILYKIKSQSFIGFDSFADEDNAKGHRTF